ncbi:MAG: 4-hydroxythreonine-4-phosphate dehydrogenase PdxA [Vicinamibacteria bacterium]|nr:4-hydroxythreonine-4-phosphate dehydrogenase PdxA [Vicinamibacteria bacterium]
MSEIRLHGDERPCMALTMGDPAGVGPEIILRALDSPERPDAAFVVYGPEASLADRARRFGLRPVGDLGVTMVDIPLEGDLVLGQCSPAGGHASARAVLRAAEDAMRGRVGGLVTAPLNKTSLHAAGYPWPGHTEMLAQIAKVSDVAMMFVGGKLRVALVTIHRSLRSVPEAVTLGEVRRVARLVHRALPLFDARRRRIALCGLNPHAGEGGLFGSEEQDVLEPASAALRAEGVDIEGPFPADTLFGRAARGEFDAVIALYHDQGLIPVKLAGFGRSVNVTLGLPFVRTSVDHGTAFDIVESGIADAGSLLEAMKIGVLLAGRRGRK